MDELILFSKAFHVMEDDVKIGVAGKSFQFRCQLPEGVQGVDEQQIHWREGSLCISDFFQQGRIQHIALVKFKIHIALWRSDFAPWNDSQTTPDHGGLGMVGMVYCFK